MAKQNTQRRPGSTGSTKGSGGGASTLHAKPQSGQGQAAQRSAQQRQQSNQSSQSSAGAAKAQPRNGAAASSAQFSAVHERVAARRTTQQKRKRYEQRKWWQGRGAIFGAIVVVALIVVIFVAIAHNQSQQNVAGIGQPVPQSILHDVTNVSPKVIQTVGTGGLNPTLATVPPSTPPIQGANGKPEFLYIGAEYCPYCAAQRWSMIVALSRFGTFKNLHLMASSANDVYANTNTFTFYGSTYTSKYLDFVSVENADRNQNPLQQVTQQQQQVWSAVMGNQTGYPFFYIGNKYTNGGSYPGGYSQQGLVGLSWQQIASKLSNANDPVTQGIVGNANYLTAAICKATNNQPGSVCAAGPIPQIEAQLPK